MDDENYIGLRIYRFYIKCPMCMAEIVFKTDPENTDYIIEAGATRNFQAQILAERQAKREAEQAEEEEKSNPMKVSLRQPGAVEKSPKQKQLLGIEGEDRKLVHICWIIWHNDDWPIYVS